MDKDFMLNYYDKMVRPIWTELMKTPRYQRAACEHDKLEREFRRLLDEKLGRKYLELDDALFRVMTDSRTNYGKQISNLIRQAYGKHLKVFEQTIPRSVRAAETSAAGKSIFAYDPKGKVAEAYKSLAKEVQADANAKNRSCCSHHEGSLPTARADDF